MGVPQVLQDAARFLSSGRPDAAAHILRQLVAQRPTLANAHALLGASLVRLGDLQGAIAATRQAVRLKREVASYHANLGEMLRQSGDLAAAADALEEAIRLDRQSAQAHNNLGIVRFDQRDLQAALAAYDRAIAILPDYPEAWNNRGNALRGLNRTEEALQCYERALTLRPTYAEAINNQGAALREMLRFDAAEQSFRAAIQLRGDYFEPYANLFTLLMALDKRQEAARLADEALKRFPGQRGAELLAARVAIDRSLHHVAQRHLDTLLATNPDDVDALALAAHVAQERDSIEAALALYDRALALAPDNSEALNGRGMALKSIGRTEEALASFAHALAFAPDNSAIIANMADLVRFTPDHPTFQMLRGLYDSRGEEARHADVALNYALGKAYDDMGEHEKALAFFSAGAKAKRERLIYDEQQFFARVAAIKAAFPAELFVNRPYAGHPSVQPVFIVGMPRSGSTLVEQILSAHSQVHGAGEVKHFVQAIRVLGEQMPTLPRFPAIAAHLDARAGAILAETYLSELGQGAGAALRITDKLLSNFLYVGLIHLVFPNARILHTRRNPIDTCLSAFTKHFKDAMAHSYDLAELGRYYRCYEELMAHWHVVLPPGVLRDVVYEDVVADTPGEARALIDFLGLDWEEACIAFHESARPVRTASLLQVRKPVYTSSIERWRRYGAGLNPLIEALGLAPQAAPETRPSAEGTSS
ncbi:MAG: tetratricopeptide repeat-containing sulfotransferase family protein [Devosia sp.]